MDDAKTASVLARLSPGPLRDAYLDAEPRGWTPLMQHARDGDEAAVARAIAAGADVDAIAEGADTALSLACTVGADAIVARLLDAGADPRARARHDLTLLHLAAAHGSLDMVRRLVDAGARIEAVVDVTPLAMAIGRDRIEILAHLITQPLPWIEPSEAFGVACECGRLDAMQLLWDRFGAAVWPQRSPTALMRAARGGDPRAVHFLIDRGAEVDDFDLKDDLSPLMHAASNGRHDAARALLERGAAATCMTEWFVTAMRIAEQRGDGPMIELLRAHGATSTSAPALHVAMPYATYSTAVPRGPSRSPLEDALASDDVAALAALALADPTGALGTAARAEAPHCVAYLLAAGADPHAGDPSALAVAVGAGCARAVRLMLAASAAPLERTIAFAATAQSDPWILRDVLERGAEVDAPRYSQRPIELAAQHDRRAHLALLLAHGARIDEDLNGQSPLSVAATRGHVRCVAMLLDHELATGGLQIITTPGQYRPHLNGLRRIDLALLAAQDPRVVELLVRRGADRALVDRLRR